MPIDQSGSDLSLFKSSSVSKNLAGNIEDLLKDAYNIDVQFDLSGNNQTKIDVSQAMTPPTLPDDSENGLMV